MPPLLTFCLPLLSGAPPTGYGWSESEVSALSTTTAFRTGIDRRDQFLGIRRCVVCGASSIEGLEHCHIIMVSEPQTWKDLKARSWIPDQAKDDPGHEPRNGMTMCAWHHRLFVSYVFFIRLLADIRKFVFINYSARVDLQQFHGKAIALDINDRYAPFPSLFIIHEMRVRGFHPFQPVSPPVPAPDDIHWQDWISSEQVFNNASASFKRNMPPHNERSAETQLPSHPTTTTTAPSGQRTLALNADVINDILAATRAMPSWKACVVEGTSWTGTAEENIQKYVSSIGTQDD